MLYFPLYTLFTWLFFFFFFCYASFSFPIKFYIYWSPPKKKKKPINNEGANSTKSNPWLGCVYKNRRGEERWGMGWGVTLPLFGCFEGEGIWGEFIISWVEADLLSDFVWMDKYFRCSYFIDLWLKATTIGSLAMHPCPLPKWHCSCGLLKEEDENCRLKALLLKVKS